MKKNDKIEWSNLGGLTSSLNLYRYDKRRRPEAYGQESEPSR